MLSITSSSMSSLLVLFTVSTFTFAIVYFQECIIQSLTLKCNRLLAAPPKEKKIIVKKVEVALEHLKVVDTPQGNVDKSEDEVIKIEEHKLEDGDTDNLQKSVDQVGLERKHEGSNDTTPTKPGTPTRTILKTPTSSRKRRVELPDTPISTRKRVKNTLIRIAEEVDNRSNEPEKKMVVDDVESEVNSVGEVKPEASKDDSVQEDCKDIIFNAPEPSEELVAYVPGLEGEGPRTGEEKKNDNDLLKDSNVNMEKQDNEPVKKSADDSYDEGKELEKWLEEERKMETSSGGEEEDQESHVDLDLEWRLRAWPLPLPSLLPPTPPSSPLLWEEDPRIRLRYGRSHSFVIILAITRSCHPLHHPHCPYEDHPRCLLTT